MGARCERRNATLPKYYLDCQEFKSKLKIKAESHAASDDVDSVLRIVVGKD